MMKTALTFLSLVLALPSLWAVTTPIPKDKIESYKLAVILAMRQSNFECSATGVAVSQYDIESLVMSAVTAEKEMSDNQRLIVFRSSRKIQSQYLVYVKTAEDQKTIVSLQAQTYSESSHFVNSGNLDNPVIISSTSLDPTGVTLCIKK